MTRTQYGSQATVKFNGEDAGREPFTIGQTEGEAAAATHFVKCFPNGWRHTAGRGRATKAVPGNFKNEKNEPLTFNHKMRIYHPNCVIWFDVYFDTDLVHIAIYSNIEKLPKRTVEFYGVRFQWNSSFTEVQITMPRHGEKYPPSHPMVHFQARAFNKQQQHVIRPELEDMFPDAILYAWDALQILRAVRKNVRRELEQLCEGSVKFYTYTRPDSKREYRMVPLGTGEDGKDQLFGLTWILPWAVSLIKDAKPSGLELDGTFEALYPYTLEICEGIIANESLPIGLAIFPTETSESYKDFHKHLAETLGEDGEAILKKLPIVSDQGKGLDGFTRDQSLIWFHCHRHLLQNAGASSVGGDWLRRLLDAGNLVEARQVAQLIRLEMKALKDRQKKLWRTDASRVALMAALDAVDASNEDAVKSWARWARLGCPTTTNSAESIHAQLNFRIKRAQSFFHRLKIVKTYLWERFAERDSEEFRVPQRSSRKWTDEKKAQTSEGNKVFYDELYRIGRDGPAAGIAWRFPRITTSPPEDFPAPEWIPVPKGPPTGWLRKERRNPAVVIEQGAQDEGETVDTGPRAPATLAARHLGGQILHSVKVMSGTKKKNAAEMKRLSHAVWACGTRHELLRLPAISLDQQIQWRLETYRDLDLLPDC
jgi:hypothetical protein